VPNKHNYPFYNCHFCMTLSLPLMLWGMLKNSKTKLEKSSLLWVDRFK